VKPKAQDKGAKGGNGDKGDKGDKVDKRKAAKVKVKKSVKRCGGCGGCGATEIALQNVEIKGDLLDFRWNSQAMQSQVEVQV
jgi:hypothetical protein